MHRGRRFGVRSRGSTPTSPTTVCPLGLLVLDTQILGISDLELAEPALSSFPRVDCALMLDPAASCFVELGPPLGTH